jgi:hypothetical protein
MGRGKNVPKTAGSRHRQKNSGRKMGTSGKVQLDQSDTSSGVECRNCWVPTAEPSGFCIDCSEAAQVSEHLVSTCKDKRCKTRFPGGAEFCDLCTPKHVACFTCGVSRVGYYDAEGDPLRNRISSSWCPALGHECFRCWCKRYEMTLNFHHCVICFRNSRDGKTEKCKFCNSPRIKCRTGEYGFLPKHFCEKCFSTVRLTSDSPFKKDIEYWVQFYQPPCLTCNELVEPRPVLRKEWYHHTNQWLDRSIAPQCRACKKRRNRSLTLLALKSVYESGLESCIQFDVRTHLCPKANLDWNPAFSSM